MAWRLSSQRSLKQIWWWFGSIGCGGGGGRWWWFVAGLLFCLFCVFVVGGGWFISDGDWGLVRRRGWSMVAPSRGGGGLKLWWGFRICREGVGGGWDARCLRLVSLGAFLGPATYGVCGAAE